MAVTQFLARLHSESVSNARTNQDALDSILSFMLGDKEAYEDFNWSPSLLEWTLQAINRHDLVTIIKQAFKGEQLLNITYPTGTHQNPVYSEVRINSVAKVSFLASQLEYLPIDTMSNAEANVRQLFPNRQIPIPFAKTVITYSRALQKFYATASRHGQEVVTWWD